MRLPLFRRIGTDQRGAALVEFAFVVPILLLLLLGLVDFGRALNYSIDETHLANEAARAVVVNQDLGGQSLTQYILGQADTAELQSGGTASLPAPPTISVCFPTNPATGTSGLVGDPVTVKLKATYNWIPFIGNQIHIASSTIQGSSTMRLEQLPSNYLNYSCT
jgi:Flp pilus assembly protein TadG